jgi:hypothetical protein
MANVYSVTYDLRTPNRDYTGLYDELKNSQKWWHFIGSTWLIYTDETPQEIWDRISNHIDKNDYALIIEVRNNCEGWLPKDAWEWINENVPSARVGDQLPRFSPRA